MMQVGIIGYKVSARDTLQALCIPVKSQTGLRPAVKAILLPVIVRGEFYRSIIQVLAPDNGGIDACITLFVRQSMR